jgi:uncharacterized protein (DUF2237 family)
VAPPVVLEATHQLVLRLIPLARLQAHAMPAVPMS